MLLSIPAAVQMLSPKRGVFEDLEITWIVVRQNAWELHV